MPQNQFLTTIQYHVCLVAFHLWSRSAALSVCIQLWVHGEVTYCEDSYIFLGLAEDLVDLNSYHFEKTFDVLKHSCYSKNWVIPTESLPESWSNISSASTAVLLNFIYNLMQVRSSNLWTIVKPFQHITKSRIIIEYLETHEWQTDSLSLAQICVEWYGHGEYNFNLITNSKLIFLDYHFSLYLQSIRIFLQFFMDFECLHFYVYILFEMNALPSYNCVRQSEYDLIHKMRMPYFTPLCRT